MYDMYLSRHLTRQREKLDEKSDAGMVQIQNIFLSLRNILAKSSFRASLNAVNLLWICCEFAVNLLWICCDYAVNIISCAIDVIMMYDSYRLPTRPPNADGHYYYSIDAPSSPTFTYHLHRDASWRFAFYRRRSSREGESAASNCRRHDRHRRLSSMTLIYINTIRTWEGLDMLGRKGIEINRKGREREWMQQSTH